MQEMDRFLEIMEDLRQKCPWDAKQTHESLKRYLLEETYETMEAIDKKDFEDLKKELGDLLLQIVFHSEIASEENKFEFKDVVNFISEKMIKRHPHVFESDKDVSAEDVQNNWEKNKHRSEQRDSLLSGVPIYLPALLKAQRMQEKASTIGFDWSKSYEVVQKLDEEVSELKEAIHTEQKNKVDEEIGDLLFTVVNISRFFKITAEEALQRSITKFENRFKYIEKHYDNNSEKLSAASLEELDALWKQAKEKE